VVVAGNGSVTQTGITINSTNPTIFSGCANRDFKVGLFGFPPPIPKIN
jgi:hypothetical protein